MSAPAPGEIPAEVVAAARQADLAGRPAEWAWSAPPEDQVRRLITGAVAAERERIRQRLVGCRECGEIHGFTDMTTNHQNRAPWVPSGPDALGFLDRLLGDGPVP